MFSLGRENKVIFIFFVHHALLVFLIFYNLQNLRETITITSSSPVQRHSMGPVPLLILESRSSWVNYSNCPQLSEVHSRPILKIWGASSPPLTGSTQGQSGFQHSIQEKRLLWSSLFCPVWVLFLLYCGKTT